MNEQLAQWREDFAKSLPIGERQRLPSQGYANFRVEFEWRGYLRARTEQAAEIAPFTPITADDVTDEMVAIYCHSGLSSRSDHTDMIVAAVNAWISKK